MNRRLYQQSHATWVCDYHIVWCPKYRGKVLGDTFIKQELKRMFKYVAKWKELRIHAWHIGEEHLHLFLSVPPKYSVAYIIQVLKGKTSMWLKKKVKKLPPGPFWARGYFVSTIGSNEHQIRNYIENQRPYQVDPPRLF
ncbi:IS200/IS605 family transposase [Patescibacteria group bacterium]|nr:IS200/IS605 family transposase [Patescibacteria group bacterium]